MLPSAESTTPLQVEVPTSRPRTLILCAPDGFDPHELAEHCKRIGDPRVVDQDAVMDTADLDHLLFPVGNVVDLDPGVCASGHRADVDGLAGTVEDGIFAVVFDHAGAGDRAVLHTELHGAVAIRPPETEALVHHQVGLAVAGAQLAGCIAAVPCQPDVRLGGMQIGPVDEIGGYHAQRSCS